MTAAHWILLFATLAAFYFLVGYPLLLGVIRWRTAPPVRKDPAYQPSVSIVLAAYNGGAYARQKMESLLMLRYPAGRLQILVVSDGSTDDTDALVSQYAHRGVTLLRVPHGGKAQALNAALPLVTGELIFFTDIRQPLEPDALAQLVANFADPTVGAVTGELRILNAQSGEQASMDLYWRFELWARSQHSNIYSLFNTTGCVYVIRRSLVQPLPPDTIADDAVLPLRAFFAGYRVIFDPAAVAYDYPMADGREFRRRLRTLAGLWQVFARTPALFLGRNRMRLHFLSHKFGRLALPWLLIIITLATHMLPEGWLRLLLVGGELMLVLLAAVDRWVPKGLAVKRLTAMARVFLLMNAAALLAMAIFFVPPSVLWGHSHVQPALTPREDQS